MTTHEPCGAMADASARTPTACSRTAGHPGAHDPAADRAADRAAYARETDAIYAREARRARDYDDGIIHDDDH